MATAILCSMFPLSLLQEGKSVSPRATPESHSLYKERAEHEAEGDRDGGGCWNPCRQPFVLATAECQYSQVQKTKVFIQIFMSCLCAGKSGIFMYWKVLLTEERMGTSEKADGQGGAVSQEPGMCHAAAWLWRYGTNSCRRWLTTSRRAYLQPVLCHRACRDGLLPSRKTQQARQRYLPPPYASCSILGCGT